MTPSLFAKYADQLFPFRWWLGAISLGGFAAYGVFLFLASPSYIRFGVAIVVPIVILSWGLLCMCVWFHPQRGNLLATSKYVRWLPGPFQSFMRWYAAIFLDIFIVVGVIVWPLLALGLLNNA